MSPDEAVALSFALFSDVPRPGLTDRLRADDPHLLERARALLPQAAAVRAAAASRGIRTVAWNEPAFPAALLTLDDLPPALWFRGELDALTAPAVAIVGSRAASAVAIETATRIANDLASRGITVVSGLARGVDSAAHRGALETGRSAAVLGSGLDRMYPAEHEPLAAQIARDGIVVSEYPPATPPLPLFFPMRNRLISGLSRAVVVIEANEKSGSLITAACALEQGREVMAVPGNVLSGRNRGAHALIRDGAKIVECADDIVEELWGSAVSPHRQQTALSSASTDVSADPIVSRMRAGEACRQPVRSSTSKSRSQRSCASASSGARPAWNAFSSSVVGRAYRFSFIVAIVISFPFERETGRARQPRAPGPLPPNTVYCFGSAEGFCDGDSGAVVEDVGTAGVAAFLRRPTVRRRLISFTCVRSSGLSRAICFAIPYALAARMPVRCFRMRFASETPLRNLFNSASTTVQRLVSSTIVCA